MRVCEACGRPHRVKEPNALGVAPYDPLLDVAAAQLTDKNTPSELRRQAELRMATVGGIEHFRAMRSALQL